MNDKSNCCDIQSMCGYSLVRGITFVGFASIAISLIVLISSIVYISCEGKKDSLNSKQPLLAINVLFALYSISVSIYQIIISVLLSWQGIQTKGNIFLCTLWYVSHLSILTFYTMFFVAKSIICFGYGKHFIGVFTFIYGTSYNAVFIYFCVSVNSYIHTLNRDRYF